MIQYEVTDSTAIKTLIYDKSESELTVIFTDGRSATYKEVPRKVFDEMIEAKSIGLYFNISVRPFYKER